MADEEIKSIEELRVHTVVEPPNTALHPDRSTAASLGSCALQELDRAALVVLMPPESPMA